MAPDDDVIGTRPKRDQLAGLPMFEAVSAAEAEREITDDFLAPPRKPPVARTATADDDAPDPKQWPFNRLSETDRAELRERIKRLARPKLLQVAAQRRDQMPAGVTADDVVAIVRQLGFAQLLGEQQRAFSWCGPWLGQLAKEGALVEFMLNGQPILRRSGRPEAHGNWQQVYLDPRDLRARRAA